MWQQRLLKQGKRVVFKTGAQVAAQERMHVHAIHQTVDFAQRLTFRATGRLFSQLLFHLQKHHDATFQKPHCHHVFMCFRSATCGLLIMMMPQLIRNSPLSCGRDPLFVTLSL